MGRSFVAVAVGLLALVVSACGGDGDPDGARGGPIVSSIRPAIDAVEAELGAGQQFFEVTANRQVVNLFIAVDDATAVVPYLFFDGALQPPAPKLTGASGPTFTADDIDFDEDTILDSVSDELPVSTIEALSLEGGADGAVRYVVLTLSAQGGMLAVTVGPDGAVLEVDPL